MSVTISISSQYWFWDTVLCFAFDGYSVDCLDESLYGHIAPKSRLTSAEIWVSFCTSGYSQWISCDGAIGDSGTPRTREPDPTDRR